MTQDEPATFSVEVLAFRGPADRAALATSISEAFGIPTDLRGAWWPLRPWPSSTAPRRHHAPSGQGVARLGPRSASATSRPPGARAQNGALPWGRCGAAAGGAAEPAAVRRLRTRGAPPCSARPRRTWMPPESVMSQAQPTAAWLPRTSPERRLRRGAAAIPRGRRHRSCSQATRCALRAPTIRRSWHAPRSWRRCPACAAGRSTTAPPATSASRRARFALRADTATATPSAIARSASARCAWPPTARAQAVGAGGGRAAAGRRGGGVHFIAFLLPGWWPRSGGRGALVYGGAWASAVCPAAAW